MAPGAQRRDFNGRFGLRLRGGLFFQLLHLSRNVGVLYVGFGKQPGSRGESVTICNVGGVLRIACSSLGIEQVSAYYLTGIASRFGRARQAGCNVVRSQKEGTSDKPREEKPPHQ